MNTSELRKYIEEAMQAEEMDRARKSTGQYQDWRIKAKEMMWTYFDEELGSLDAKRKNSLNSNKSSDVLIDKVFNLIRSTIAGEVPQSVRSIRKGEEEKRSWNIGLAPLP